MWNFDAGEYHNFTNNNIIQQQTYTIYDFKMAEPQPRPCSPAIGSYRSDTVVGGLFPKEYYKFVNTLDSGGF